MISPTDSAPRAAEKLNWADVVAQLAGKAVRLRFVLRDADLYAFQFVPYAPEPQRPALPEPPQ